MLVGDDSFLLTIKLFAFLLKDFIANTRMLVKGLTIKVATAVRALVKVHFRGFRSEGIWSKVVSLLFKCG